MTLSLFFKKNFFIIFILFFNIQNFAEAMLIDPDIIVIYNIENRTENKQNNFYSKIIPVNFAKEFAGNKNYIIKLTSQSLNVYDKNHANFIKFKNTLAQKAKEENADCVLSGFYISKDDKIYLKFYAYFSHLDKILEIDGGNNDVGVFLSRIIEKSLKIIRTTLKKNIYRVKKPLFSPKEKTHRFYQDIKITTKTENADIYYTLNESIPPVKNGKKLNKSFRIRKSSTIKAIGHKKRWKYSPLANYSYQVVDPLSSLTVGVDYGQMFFTGDWGKKLKKDVSPIISAYTYFQLANFSFLKDIFFINNFGIIASVDSGHAQSSSEYIKHQFNFYGACGGLIYKLRFGEYLDFDLIAQAGIIKTTTTKKEQHDGLKNMLKYPDNFEESRDAYYSSSVLINLKVGSLLVRGGASFKRINYIDDPMNIIIAQAGLGINFF